MTSVDCTENTRRESSGEVSVEKKLLVFCICIITRFSYKDLADLLMTMKIQ